MRLFENAEWQTPCKAQCTRESDSEHVPRGEDCSLTCENDIQSITIGLIGLGLRIGYGQVRFVI